MLHSVRFSAVALGLTVPLCFLALYAPGALAVANKADVCHGTGNGSFQLLNISDRAVKAHLNHGDGLPGDPVPGNPGSVFDEACNVVQASSCPCDFTSTALSAAGIDGTQEDGCFANIPGEATGIGVQETDGSALVVFNETDGFCQLGEGGSGGFADILNQEEYDGCEAQLLDHAEAVGLPECEGPAS